MKITIELDGVGDLFELKRLLSGLKPRLPDGLLVSELGLDARTVNVLKAEDITEARQLLGKTDSDFLKIPNMGRRSLNAIRDALKANGLESV